MIVRLFVSFFCFLLVSLAWSQHTTSIEGIAPHAIGKQVIVYEILDFLTMSTSELTSTKVKEDSTFHLSFSNTKTQKFKVQIGKDYLFLYASPGQKYTLFVKEGSNYNARRPEGNEVGFFFLGLDSTDINHKILFFEDQQLDFLTQNYTKDNRESEIFVKRLQDYKLAVEKKYASDTSTFFKTYIKFAVASLDDLAFVGNRNRYEKFDFYIKFSPIAYSNDRYMEYIFNYFHNYAALLSPKVNEGFYDGVVRSSPTIIINKLHGDYALEANLKLRELVMVKMLGDVYYSKEYPQTNIITILDSVALNGLFESNRLIAKNLKSRLTALVKGGLMPDFVLTVDGKKVGKNDFMGKHVYLQYVNTNLDKSIGDIKLIAPLVEKYGEVVDFLTLIVVPDKSSFKEKEFIERHRITWKYSVVERSDNFIQQSSVATYPYYVLLDAHGYVVAAPALSPRPNNEYETIERFLFSIKKIRDREKQGGMRRGIGPENGN